VQSLFSRDDKERLALIRQYEETVGDEGIRKARANDHSRRRPIQCGLTVHPGNDCAYSCTYCYIPDMGFRFRKPELCGLSSKQLVLSLLLNPSFVPGRQGTYIAIGSVVEPFQPELKLLTMNYIKELAKLGNPIQFSSKSFLSGVEAESLSSSCKWLSPLITILALEESKARVLEPIAPTTKERLETISNLTEAGLKPFLFLRPILPGIITMKENERLIDECIEHGAEGVVLGNFRVTRRIVESMRKKNLDLSEILKRAPTVNEKQRTIYVSDIQRKIEQQFGKKTRVFRRSCCASAYCADLEKCAHELTLVNRSIRR